MDTLLIQRVQHFCVTKGLWFEHLLLFLIRYIHGTFVMNYTSPSFACTINTNDNHNNNKTHIENNINKYALGS